MTSEQQQETTLTTYEQMECIQDLYLEDSFVLLIKATLNSLELEIDAVMQESHPSFRPPLAGEPNSYIRATIRLLNASELRWLELIIAPTANARSEVVIGSLYEINLMDNCYDVIGDWGHEILRMGLHSR